jgi:N-acetyl-anhydromuramyl-L-alanine amidase AmpD
VGAHASALKDGLSMNYQSLGICLTGNFETEEPTKEQIATLEAVLSDKRAQFGIARANVLGHQEIPAATACPGKNLMPFIKTYRARPEQQGNSKQVFSDLADSIEQKVEELKKEIQKLP